MWREEDNRLKARFIFKDFISAFSFMTSVALAAEKMDHHPNWFNSWNIVEIELCTHSAGNTITDKDKNLAEKISAIYSKFHRE